MSAIEQSILDFANRFVRTASNNSVMEGFALVKQNLLTSNSFLSISNPFKNDLSNIIKNSTHTANGIFTLNQIQEYTASASLIHCFDGWDYLTRAVNSYINGDKYITLHLAYYAELRASISFLASEGINIINSNHIAIDDHAITFSNTRQIKGSHKNNEGTHSFTWYCLKAWIENIEGKELLKYFSYKNRTFSDWLSHMPGSNNRLTISDVIKRWVKSWCFDISGYTNDRNARNNISYRPSHISNFSTSLISDSLDSISDCWKWLEPGLQDRFMPLDKFLFKDFIKSVYEYHSQSQTLGIHNSLKSFIRATMIDAGEQEIDLELEQWIDSNIINNIISNAHNKALNSVTNVPNPISVISRALLMLRLASSASNIHLKQAGISRENLHFYFDCIGKEFGFWDEAQMPTTFDELWTDISDCIDDVTYWSTNNHGKLRKKYFLDFKPTFNEFCQFNRAALWGTGF